MADERMVRFGGPNLPPGRSTWYDHRNPDGNYGGQIIVRPGDMVAANRIGGEIKVPVDDAQVWDAEKGEAVMVPQPPQTIHGRTVEYYIDAGVAAYVK